MPIPDHVARLRTKIGTDLLLLPGVASVIFDEAAARVLLGRRSDNGRWAHPSGIMEPGEHPAAAIIREVREETSVEVRVDRLIMLHTHPEVTYPNGDRCQFVTSVFRCTYVAGDPAVGDDESSEVGWFALDALPAGMSSGDRRRIELARPLIGDPVLSQ